MIPVNDDKKSRVYWRSVDIGLQSVSAEEQIHEIRDEDGVASQEKLDNVRFVIRNNYLNTIFMSRENANKLFVALKHRRVRSDLYDVINWLKDNKIKYRFLLYSDSNLRRRV